VVGNLVQRYEPQPGIACDGAIDDILLRRGWIESGRGGSFFQ